MILKQIKDFFNSLKLAAKEKFFSNLKRWPSKNQWLIFFKVLTKREKIAFFIFLIFFFSSSFFLSLNFYFKNTEIQPDFGGMHIEGVVGSPRFINPIYAPASDTDRDLTELIFSGLLKYNQFGEIVPDLAKSYQILEEGRVYEIYLKENLSWSDGSPLTVDDVVFTIKTIQNPEYKSPIRASWLGVEIEKISDLGLRFKLRNPYPPFLENLTLKIMPEKIWRDISPQNFPLSIHNLKPIGSGPYKLKSLEQDSLGRIISLTVVRNPYYHGKSPYLGKIIFHFFEKEEDLIKAAKKGEIKGFSLTSPKNLSQLKDNFNSYSFSLPRYFALFFNPERAGVLKEKEVRLALNYGTNKEEIVEKVLFGQGKVVHSPILPEIFGFRKPEKIYQFDLEKAKEILNEAGFLENEKGLREKIIKKEPAFQLTRDLRLGSRGKDVEKLQRCLAKDPEIYPEGQISGYFGEKTRKAVIRFQEKYKKEILEPGGLERGTGLVFKTTRTKLNELCFRGVEERLILQFSLAIPEETVLREVANLLKNQWQKLGVELKITTFEISQLSREIIKPRNYQILLFGQVLGKIPDPFPFWHSIQTEDPGLNLAIYRNKKADKLLEEARQSQDFEKRKEKLEQFQDILIKDAPSVFLYSPDYLYFVSKKIKGVEVKMIVDPSKRFSGIENWYSETKRVWR